MGETILGPIDYLAVEWPDQHVTGEGFRLLMDLVDREIVRVLDLLFIAKDADGKVSRVDVADVEHSEGSTSGCGVWRPACLTNRTSTRSPRRSSRAASRESSFMRTSGRSRCGPRSTAATRGLSARGASSLTI
jgi:hypothetical protein